MRKLALAIAATVAVGLATGAEAKVIKSSIELAGAGYGTGTVQADGFIESRRSGCLSTRRVQISALIGGEVVQLDTDLSSLNGYWGGEGAGEVPDEIRVRMKPERISKRKKCSGDRDADFGMRALPREKFPSSLLISTLTYAGDEVGGTGRIESTSRCVARRKVKVFDFDDGERGAFRAQDISSRNGYWGAHGDSDSQGVSLVLPEERLGPGVLCGPTAIDYDPDPQP